MDMDEDVNADNKEQLQVEETDDSCILDYIEIVPVDRDTDGGCTTECVSGDWLGEVKQENLAVVKQEPDDVYCVIFACFCCIVYCSSKNLKHLLLSLIQVLGIGHVFQCHFSYLINGSNNTTYLH